MEWCCVCVSVCGVHKSGFRDQRASGFGSTMSACVCVRVCKCVGI